jgi:hypothetical protein
MRKRRDADAKALTENVPQPWLYGVEPQLRERKGLLLISLLVDEAGAMALRDGIIPPYVQQQAADALAWSATDARGNVTSQTRASA